ncbi:alpha/beta fold hydrolase [Achromobacter aloeverae]|uniref:Alpha/beta hydrolase n=1 Tax=Achromobacter aloeverae TaxID=1750518 RepID=A0A4Q1HFN6_9BURK|nr:alpha/beta hydrolase [Achromobacter aloeverae]RXN85925.1 alpha/beta hydrolase [Achromobacter aloeverae]
MTTASTSSASSAAQGGRHDNAFVATRDGTRIFYKDWGQGRPVVFSHGWPLNADAWDNQMLFLAQNGFRVIAHDRRGHGRSDQPSQGNDMDTYADDLAAVIEALDLKDATLVGHSTGGGEVARYIGRHGTSRIAAAVLIGAVPPIMVKSDKNPGGLPKDVFDGIRKGVADNRSRFYQELAIPFFGFNRPGAAPEKATIDAFWAQGMAGGILGQYLCIHEFSEVDYTPDLEKIDVPTLVLHGDDDQIVPIDNAGRLSARIVKQATLTVVEGGSHGMCVTHADRINAELLAFLKR